MTTLMDTSPTITCLEQHNDLSIATDSNATGTMTESTSPPPSPLQNNTNDYHIRVLGIAEQGAKSRVETQIRLTIELLDKQGEKVENWSHIQLPAPLLTTKRRNASTTTLIGNNTSNNKRKSTSSLSMEQQQSSSINVPEESILHLRASVICESDINRKVKMCQRCVWREWKRADRKKTGRRLGTTTYDETLMERERQRILLFNSDPLLTFHSGECVLPTRITCYSRHHDERQGFRIKFTVHDHCDNLVGSGTSPPIMITDDHKNLSKLGDKRRRRRKQKPVSPVNESLPTPKEETLATFDQDPSMLLVTSNDSKIKQEPLDLPTDFLFDSMGFEDTKNHHTSLMTPMTTTTTTATSSSLDHSNLLDPCLFFPTTPSSMQDIQQLLLPSLLSSPSSPTETSSPGSSSPTSPFTSPPLYQQHQHNQHLHQQQQHDMMYGFLPSLPTLPPPMMLAPKIERMIPDQASMEGGAEITLLGSNFHEGLTCYFGDKPALTAYWSPTTLVCTVPSSLHPGPVLITLESTTSAISTTTSSSSNSSSFMSSLSGPPQIFTYHSATTSTTSSSTTTTKTTSPFISHGTTTAPIDIPSSSSSSSGWDEQTVQTLTWQVLNLNMAQNFHDARQIALKLIHL